MVRVTVSPMWNGLTVTRFGTSIVSIGSKLVMAEVESVSLRSNFRLLPSAAFGYCTST